MKMTANGGAVQVLAANIVVSHGRSRSHKLVAIQNISKSEHFFPTEISCIITVHKWLFINTAINA